MTESIVTFLVLAALAFVITLAILIIKLGLSSPTRHFLLARRFAGSSSHVSGQMGRIPPRLGQRRFNPVASHDSRNGMRIRNLWRRTILRPAPVSSSRSRSNGGAIQLSALPSARCRIWRSAGGLSRWSRTAQRILATYRPSCSESGASGPSMTPRACSCGAGPCRRICSARSVRESACSSASA